jgi:hypothetical protein
MSRRPTSGGARSVGSSSRPEVPLWRWGAWMGALGAALVLFYVLLTPVWFSLRTLAWLAEFRERRRRTREKIGEHD